MSKYRISAITTSVLFSNHFYLVKYAKIRVQFEVRVLLNGRVVISEIRYMKIASKLASIVVILAIIALAGEHIFQVLAQYSYVLLQYLQVLPQYLLVFSR